MQAQTGEANVYYANARNCRVMPLACSANPQSVGSRQVVTHALGLRLPQFWLGNSWIFFEKETSYRAMPQLRQLVADFLQHSLRFNILNQNPATVRNVMCGAGTDCELFRAQARVWFRTHKVTIQCITHLLRSAHTVCPHVVYRMAVNNDDCSHNSLNTGFRIAKWVYYEVPT